MFEAAPVAPPVAGLAAATAGPASGDGFAEFWRSWPRKHGKKKAEAEWAKIVNDVDIIIEVAGTWAEHYRKHGVDMKWIPEPANWLRDERWDEDLPIIHIDAKGASIARSKANSSPAKEPANDNTAAAVEEPDFPEWTIGRPVTWPIGHHVGEFVDGQVVDASGDKEIQMVFRREDGALFEHRFYTEAFMQAAQDEGQAVLRNIIRALEIDSIHDTDELLFKPIAVDADGSTLTYSAISLERRAQKESTYGL